MRSLIATPHDQLAPIALAAVEAGRMCWSRSRRAATPAEVAPLLAAADKHKRIVKVGFNHRFHPAIARAKKLVDDGAVGAADVHSRPLRPWRPHRL